jgi:hypothetical protein
MLDKEVHYKKLHHMIKWNGKKKKTNKVKIILKVHNYWLERKRESKTHDQGTLSSQKNVSSHLKALQNPLGGFL